MSTVFTCECYLGVREYFSLDQKAKAEITDWEIREKSPAGFSVSASYRFFASGKREKGVTEFTPPYFPTKEAAELAIKSLAKEPWQVFFDRFESKKNSLQRVFPFLLCIRAFLALASVLYCSLLKKYAAKSRV